MPIRLNQYDAIIVGARAAGAATAMLLARGGLKVLVVERSAYGADTLSSHALMRPAVMQLARWGLLGRIIESGAPVISRTVFHYGDDETTVDIRPEPDVPGLVAPRRTILDSTLVDAARAAGAEIIHEASMLELLRDPGGSVKGVVIQDNAGMLHRICAGIVIGADGIHSTTARMAGAQKMVEGVTAAAHVYGYVPVDDPAAYHWYFRPGISASLIPTNQRQACLVASFPSGDYERHRRDLGGARVSILFALSPKLGEIALRGMVRDIRTFRGTPGFLRQAHGPGWALVGDAGFFRDPLTAHGISDALRDAEGLANAILAGSVTALADYQQERDSVARPLLETTDAVASFDWQLDDLADKHRAFSQAMKTGLGVIKQRQMGELQPA